MYVYIHMYIYRERERVRGEIVCIWRWNIKHPRYMKTRQSMPIDPCLFYLMQQCTCSLPIWLEATVGR